jgi:hypothetical protein
LESKWSGDAENAFFSSDVFDAHRVILRAEDRYSGNSKKDAYYVLGVDVGRKGCASEVMVIKVTPQSMGGSIKSLVNLYSFNDEHFETQAIAIKKLYYSYKARAISLDGNGLGIGLVDYLVKSQIDPDTNNTLPDFGIINDKDGFYKKFKTPITENNAIYIIKANASINTEAYSYLQSQMSSGKIKFLIDERQAKIKLMSTKAGQVMDAERRNDWLMPYTLTTILREQLLNLVEEHEGINITLKQASRSIRKDKFSALIYGLYFVKKEEENSDRRKKKDLSKLMFFS